MGKLPNSLAIALWTVGSCWVVAVIGYIFGAPRASILSLIGFGLVSGFAEFFVRKRP